MYLQQKLTKEQTSRLSSLLTYKEWQEGTVFIKGCKMCFLMIYAQLESKQEVYLDILLPTVDVPDVFKKVISSIARRLA
jgi:hypothetical protein